MAGWQIRDVGGSRVALRGVFVLLLGLGWGWVGAGLGLGLGLGWEALGVGRCGSGGGGWVRGGAWHGLYGRFSKQKT